MSEFIAEAQVLVTPNLATFAATLRKQLEVAVAAAGPVVIPVAAGPTGTAGSAALIAAQEQATAATLGLSAATGLEADALDLVAKAQLDAAAAAELAGAAASAEAIQMRLLAAANDAAVIAFKKSEAVAVASVGATSELAGARATLVAATKSVIAQEVAFDAALATNSDLMKEDAASALVDARAMQVNAKATFDAALGHRNLAKAEAESAAGARASAASHAQAARGLSAEVLALGGLRGATLAASAPFLIGATSAIVFAKSIKEASDANEEFNKTSVVFGSSAEQIQKFAETTATSLGISSTEALRAAGIFGNLFRSVGLAQQPSADLSESLVKLAADLASFNNADPSRTLEALRSGLVGQARPLRVFGIFLSQARAQQQALIDTGKKNVQELTNAELVQARYNIIIRDSSLAQGDFAKTSERLANQSRILKAQLSDTGESIGKVLLPALTNVIGLVNDYVATVGTAITATEAFGKALGKIPGPTSAASGHIESFEKKVAKLYFRFAILGPVMGAATLAERQFGAGADEVGPKVDALTKLLQGASGAAADLAAALLTKAIKPTKDVARQLQSLEVDRLKIQTGLAPGGRQAEEANLRKQIQLDKQAVALAKSGTAARKAALQELHADQQDLDSLEAQDAADAKARADAAQQSAKDAKAQSERIQAAALAKKKAAQAAAKAQREADAAQAQALAERKQAIIDARQAHLEALLSIAETTASTRDDAAAEKALIRFDQVQIRRILAIKRRRRLTLDEAAQLDAYRVDLAQRNAAIKAVQKTAEDTNKSMKSLAFTFLQAQQGFAANLLGNLIPGFATKGLVGGSQATGADGLRQVAGGFEQPRGAVESQASIATSRDRGVRPVQVDTTNQILRQILRTLQGRPNPPEITHNRQRANAAYDTLGAMGD